MSETSIAVIDYGMGNLMSVINALAAVDASATVVQDPKRLDQFDKIIVPGVGAFGEAMAISSAAAWPTR